MVGRSRGWRLLVLGGVVVAVAVAGCTAGESEPTPTTPVETRSTSSAPQTSEPTVAAPQMPAEANEASAAGAEAWVGHWIALLNYAYDTGDTEPLKALSPSECQVCAGTIADIDDVYESGGWLEGAQMTASRVLSSPPDVRNLVSVSVTFTEAESTSVDANGERTVEPATVATNVGFVMVHENGTWQLRGIGTE